MRRLKGIFTMKHFFEGCLITLVLFSPFSLISQDTLNLTLKETEERFLKENLLIMAEKLELDIMDLEIKKAGLWDNPEFEIEHQIINRSGKGPIGFTGSDNTAFGMEQLIVTAGKRGHRIKLAELDKVKVEHQLQYLTRQFIRSLREEFFKLAFLNRIEGLYQEQIDALDQILSTFEAQQDGNIPRIEIIRLRSLLLELEKDYSEILGEIEEARQVLRILLQLEDQVPVPQIPSDISDFIDLSLVPQMDELYERALESRRDLRVAQASIASAERSLMLEQANRYPDLGVGLVYDRLDGLVDNYFGITFSLELPIWNRNRENIQIAQHQIRQNELLLNQKEGELFQDVRAALNRYQRALRLLDRVDTTFEDEFGAILESITLQYRQGEMRLIEFIDFYESFRDGIKRNYSVQEELIQAAEELNYTVGEDIFQFNF